MRKKLFNKFLIKKKKNYPLLKKSTMDTNLI